MRSRRLPSFIVALIIAASAATAQAGQRQSAGAPAHEIFEARAGAMTAADGRVGTPVVVRFDRLADAAKNGGELVLPLTNGVVARATIAWRYSDAGQTFVGGPLVSGDGEASL